MIEVDGKVANAERAKDVASNSDALIVGYHPVICPCFVKIALIELTIPYHCDLGLIPEIHLADVIPLNDSNIVEGKEAHEWHCKFVPQHLEIATLIDEKVDKLGILTILACEGITQLKHRGVGLQSDVVFEYPLYDLKGTITDHHLLWDIIEM